MEGAPLRRVPSLPPSRVDPAEAFRHVATELPALDAPAARALALVAIAGRTRDDEVVAHEAGVSGEELAEGLARARKALRRRLHPLPGSGWCERAERLISDRLDDTLVDPGPARLEVHLSNCSRCVEHERRLAQAQDALVAGFVQSSAPPPEPEADVEVEVEDEDSSEKSEAPVAVQQPAALRIVDTPRLTGSAPEVLPEADEAPALPEPEEPAAALPEPEEPAAALPDPVEPPPPPPPAPLYVPPPAAPEPPRRAPSPPRTRSRVAAAYAPRPTLDGAGRADEETWAAVAPLLAISTLAILMMVFAVLAVSL